VVFQSELLIKRGWIDESCNTRLHLTANSHQLWARSNFDESWWEFVLVCLVICNQRSSNVVQLLFSFDRGTRIEKTLVQYLAWQLSCNSCSRLTEAQELRKLSWKLSLGNSHQLSSTLMQPLFSFDRGTSVKKILMQTLASQHSSTLSLELQYTNTT
jgi:hypothetical protein